MDLKGRSLYEALGLEKDATQSQIKKAYHRLAMQLHPDKNPGNQEATQRFQTLQRIYQVLGDTERRAVYDQTGSLQDTEELSGEQFNDLYSYYRAMYPKVTEADLDRFQADYRGSPEEQRDLLAHYARFHGDMAQVFEWQICSEPKLDSHRFMDQIQAAIAAGQAEEYPKFRQWCRAVQKMSRPRNPLQPKKQQAHADDTALVASIRGRQQQMNSFLAGLEDKYCANPRPADKKSRKGTKTSKEEPSEADFAKAQARITDARQKKRAKR